jgi:hypothetical protein
MPVRNLSSTVRFKSSDASPDIRRRYGLYDDDADALAVELEQHTTGDERWRQDQRLKDGITSALHRLELDSVKPGFDVLSQTGFRRGYQVRGRKPSRRHSYIEPSRSSVVHLETREHAPVPILEERSVRFSEAEPVVHRHVESSYSPTWYYTEPPRSYSYSTRSTSTPPARRTIAAQPEGHRALSEYRDTLVAAPRPVHQRWSVYGATPSTDIRLRSRSTPPDVYRPSTARLLPVGDRLSRRGDHEHAVGVKLAESQKDIDTFSRLLEKRFGANSGGSSYYGVYPSYPSTYYTSPLFYDYSRPVTTTNYSYDLYSPRTRVVKPSGTVVYGSPYSYTDYVPYTSSYSRYIPYSHVDYGRSSYSGYEPGYYSSYVPSYVPRSGYYTGRSRYLL